MKGRSNRGRSERPKVRSRVFVTPGTPLRAPGGVYTLTGKPLSLPPASSVRQITPLGELDDWVPEPESYLPQDEAFEEFEVSSGADAVPSVADTDFEEELGYPSHGGPFGGIHDIGLPALDDGGEPSSADPEPLEPEGIERPGSPVMAPVAPSRPQPYIGEEVQPALPIRIASSTGVRWRKK